jgi:hypothetical protein
MLKVLTFTWLVTLTTNPTQKLCRDPTSVTHQQGSSTVEKGLLGITKDTPLASTTQEISRVLEALCQELGSKGQYIFFIYHNTTVTLYKKKNFAKS